MLEICLSLQCWKSAMLEICLESACNAGNLGLILGLERFAEKGMATHSNILAWRILRTDEPGRLQSMGSQRGGHD